MNCVNPRPTVAGLVYTVCSDGSTALIAAHWPEKAKAHGESNLTTVAGEWLPEESQEDAMLRLMLVEYGLPSECCEITPLMHPRFISRMTAKRYFRSLVKVTGQVLPNNLEVASFGWYPAPAALRTAIAEMHAEKARMFRQVIALASNIEESLRPYRVVLQMA